ncbi:translesion DNA synthesis-associated protein ImuA [Uliginosibacterium sp. H1]|uniref:translesion DNA synthesis-associated protein ImuA n=1 Tax=Uliginosibacterium sp. H1 TaxID=3114757 RepID=UPI002E1759BA|nr:translesion DNA synthesis-associated protein ImuA [Uliginosibacterium sp. H1]
MSLAPIPLENLLLRPDLWRGDRLASLGTEPVASGFENLDAELPGGGWPRGGLIELMAGRQGIGEISLLLPALRRLEDSAPIALVAPPAMAHAPAWAAAFPLSRLLVVEAEGDDIAWSTELLLASGALGALLAWLPAKSSNKSLRRLQLAAEGRLSLAFMFRPPGSAGQASPAPLRLQLAGARQGLRVDVFKRRGPPCNHSLLLPVERPVSWQRRATAGPSVTLPSTRTLELVR